MFEGSLGGGKGARAGEDTAGKMTPTGIKDLFKNYLGTLQKRRQAKFDLGGPSETTKFPDSAIEALRTAYKEKTGEDAPEGAWGVDSAALDKHAAEKGIKPKPVKKPKPKPEKAEPKAEEAGDVKQFGDTTVTKGVTEEQFSNDVVNKVASSKNAPPGFSDFLKTSEGCKE